MKFRFVLPIRYLNFLRATENPFTCNTYSIAQPIGLIEKSKSQKQDTIHRLYLLIMMRMLQKE